MKLSAWVAVGDLIPQKKTVFERLVIGKFIYQSIFYYKNPKRVLLELKKNGVDGIELLLTAKTSEKDLDKISKLIKQLDMKIFSIHQPLSKLFNISILEINNLCQVAKKLSAKVVVLHINVIGNQIFDKKYILNLKNLEKDYGIKIGIENSPKSILTLFKPHQWKQKEFSMLIKNNGLNITFDTTHLAQVGGNILDFYANNKQRIVNIHLSDYKKHPRNTILLMTHDTHLPISKGILPMKEFLQTLKMNKYDGLITMEINSNLEDLSQSAKFIKNNF